MWRCRDAAGEDRRAALEALVHRYWRPIHGFYRRALGLRDDELEEVTQEFFVRLVDPAFLAAVKEPRSFRGFLKTACRRLLLNLRRDRRVRDAREGPLAQEPPDPDDGLDAIIDAEFRAIFCDEAWGRVQRAFGERGKSEWVAAVVERARDEGGRPPTYEAIAGRLGVSVSDVRNYLHAVRAAFREELVRVAAEHADDPLDELRSVGITLPRRA